MGKRMYNCILAYMRRLPWVKCHCCLPPRASHELLFALGIARCFLLPLDYLINAGSELWELSGRFWFACGGTESRILTAVTGTEVQPSSAVGPELVSVEACYRKSFHTFGLQIWNHLCPHNMIYYRFQMAQKVFPCSWNNLGPVSSIQLFSLLPSDWEKRNMCPLLSLPEKINAFQQSVNLRQAK